MEIKIPLVSIVIPMYNSATFIAQTLESLLYQTMTDFEVIIVDDCSTDNGIEVAKNFAARFGGRLNIIKLPKNNGNPAVPRNFGIQLSRGKYVTFMDSDDIYTKTALEELSTLAEETQADVVHSDTFFMLFEKNPKTDAEYAAIKNFQELLAPENLTVCKRQKLPPLNEPMFETPDLAQRIHNWVNRGYNWEPYTMFCKKNFLVVNQIKFPHMAHYEDQLFSFHLLCAAEKFLRVPNLTYIYRQVENSFSRKTLSNKEQYFNKWFSVLRDGINEYERIMASANFFRKYPKYRYAVLDFFAAGRTAQLFSHHLRIPLFAFDDMLKKEFRPDNAPLVAYLFHKLELCQRQIEKLQQEPDALKQSR